MLPRARLRQYQRLLAPGTPLRAGLDRILHGRTGAIVVLGNNSKVQQVSSGGFQLNVEFTPQALRELAKLDGAIILTGDLTRIVAAGVHLVPAGDLPTAETGTRHRSADRTAQATGLPVVTVSASMSTISLFMNTHRHVIETTDQMISRANQTLATLARVTSRLEAVLEQLNSLEVGEQVTIRDLVQVAHRYEMTRRLSQEMQFHIDTLGVEGRLTALQHSELMVSFENLAQLIAADYAHNLEDPSAFTLERLENFSADELLSTSLVAERLGFGPNVYLETPVNPRGIRLLSSVGRLPDILINKLVERYALQEMFGASVSDLLKLEGVGSARARLIRDALLRITEAAYSRPEQPT
ncbi:DNA integrity scanning diadenylate cyclase DisA [Tessaracoccus sp. OS52]|uniref:DNA integrity scanning diadenylate cyclase DisA n=1 Tax=Tessaracoccus sp. OS52 TaxID=2886691 RepID=UPI001D1194B5|nr:DNA integrity scanning diadenylate cyclase DisA [Tessaracoccus sp. OS52]MCC2594658.1 DNA integrity scanning diadenylate cyclase DisA [Tessaracoccus sp. OS52]